MSKRGLRKPRRDRLSVQIMIEHEAVRRGLLDTLTHAKRAGDLLNRAKDQMAHGTFMRWVRDDCGFSSHDTPNLYMRVARDWDWIAANSERVRNFSLRAVVTLLRSRHKAPIVDHPTLTGRSTEWLHNYQALYQRINGFLEPHQPEARELQALLSTMNRVERERMREAFLVLRGRANDVIEQLERGAAFEDVDRPMVRAHLVALRA